MKLLKRKLKEKVTRGSVWKTYYHYDLALQYILWCNPAFAYYFITLSNKHKQNILARIPVRLEGIQVRKDLCGAVKQVSSDFPFEERKDIYSYVTNMGYEVLFNKTAKQISVLTHKRNPRDFFGKRSLYMQHKFEHQLEGALLDTTILTRNDFNAFMERFCDRFRKKYVKEDAVLFLSKEPVTSKSEIHLLSNKLLGE